VILAGYDWGGRSAADVTPEGGAPTSITWDWRAFDNHGYRNHLDCLEQLLMMSLLGGYSIASTYVKTCETHVR